MKTFSFSAAVSVLGTTLSGLLGGWDMLIQALLVFMAIDYATGLLSAIKDKRVNSEVMWWGGIRKGVVLSVIAIAAFCDSILGMDPPVLRALAIYFYISREGLSILENIGKLGVPLPAFIRSIFEQLRDRGGDEDKRGGGKRDGKQKNHLDGK